MNIRDTSVVRSSVEKPVLDAGIDKAGWRSRRAVFVGPSGGDSVELGAKEPITEYRIYPQPRVGGIAGQVVGLLASAIYFAFDK